MRTFLSLPKRIISFLPIAIIAVFFFISPACKKVLDKDAGVNYLQFQPYGLTKIDDVLPLKNGEILVLGLINDRVVLTRTSAEGRMIWQKDLTADFTNIEYYKRRVAENADGSILLAGNKENNPNSLDFNITKLDANGSILKKTNYSIFPYDSAISKTAVLNTFRGNFCPDGTGGYYFQIALTYQNNYLQYILHYNAMDNFDNNFELVKMDPSYANAKDIYLGYQGNGEIYMQLITSNNFYKVDRIDGSTFSSKPITKLWSRTLPAAKYIEIVNENDFIWNVAVNVNTSGGIMEGITVTKLNSISGNTEKIWDVPLQLKTNFLFDNGITLPVADENAIYVPLQTNYNSYIVKTNKDGSPGWTVKVGGNKSKYTPIKMVLLKDQILVFGSGTLNKDVISNAFMCRLDKNGNFLAN